MSIIKTVRELRNALHHPKVDSDAIVVVSINNKLYKVAAVWQTRTNLKIVCHTDKGEADE